MEEDLGCDVTAQDSLKNDCLPRPPVYVPWLLKQMPCFDVAYVRRGFLKTIALMPLKTYQVMPKYKFQPLDHDF